MTSDEKLFIEQNIIVRLKVQTGNKKIQKYIALGLYQNL